MVWQRGPNQVRGEIEEEEGGLVHVSTSTEGVCRYRDRDRDGYRDAAMVCRLSSVVCRLVCSLCSLLSAAWSNENEGSGAWSLEASDLDHLGAGAIR